MLMRIQCGKRGIRTPDTLLTYTRFPGVPLQPLEHLSRQQSVANRVQVTTFFLKPHSISRQK